MTVPRAFKIVKKEQLQNTWAGILQRRNQKEWQFSSAFTGYV